MVLDADLSSSTKTKYFREKFPKRFFNIGIAEQNMIGIARGLACSGKIPIISGFSCFTIGRAWEFIKMAAYDELSLKICTSHSGLSNGKDGASHQMLEDLSLLLSIPNVRIFCPSDPIELQIMLKYMISSPGVTYVRLMRNVLPWVWSKNHRFQEDFIEKLYETSSGIVQITIFSTGSLTTFAPSIIQELEKRNYIVRVIHIGQIKPINEKKIAEFASKTKIIITLEEHNIIAGFGAALSRIISKIKPKPLLSIGINDSFGQTGTMSELYTEYGLDIPSIILNISNFYQKFQEFKEIE